MPACGERQESSAALPEAGKVLGEEAAEVLLGLGKEGTVGREDDTEVVPTLWVGGGGPVRSQGWRGLC